MSLDWNIDNVHNWKEIAEDQHERVITQTIVFGTMAIDIGTLTEDNWMEAYARFDLVQRWSGAWVHRNGEPYYLTADDFKRRIGLTTNVFPEKTRAQWMQRYVSKQMDELIARHKAYERMEA